ncbi:Gfo/Idh/MocA family protein [Paenibacillus sp. 481]|uniref:Gfo/Idh/MocA family protein n=1 Tax=Paenibacillus sp. 481 TaxID=2835869 RepID=UPI001E500CFC|nr:Gfo/Idh/MocA family oxidoreductase [Paenibacillus sp. 481]UHA74535.1 Gfo/Idh/MocA family oxidoreductase [Paenibacillus sp. 481]
MKQPRIGIIGLGDIALKAYLPVLSRAEQWSLVGAFTPNEQKRHDVCAQYRMRAYDNIKTLADDCDALFVHSSTATHYEIIKKLIYMGKDVYVDKPLAETLEQAEHLVELSEHLGRKIMVGFNRRFAPCYQRLAEAVPTASWMRIEKHRADNVYAVPHLETMLDDYIHIVDLVRHLGGSQLTWNGQVNVNSEGHLIDAHHVFRTPEGKSILCGMHRRAGMDSERVELVGDKRVVRVNNVTEWTTEENGHSYTEALGSWVSVAKARGFEDAIKHFIHCITHDEQPLTNAREAYESQALVCKLAEQTTVVK